MSSVDTYKDYLDKTVENKRLFYFNEKYWLDIDLIKNWHIEDNVAVINFIQPVLIDGGCQIRIEYETETEAIEVMNRMWEWYCK